MKRVFKEFDRTLYSVDIMFYAIMSFIGYFLIKSDLTGGMQIYKYAVAIFFVFAFFSILAYFLNRRKNDYEFLYFGLINIGVASFLLFNKTNTEYRIRIEDKKRDQRREEIVCARWLWGRKQ